MPIREICSQKIVDIQPLRCYSELVYEKYTTIKELLKVKISEDFYHFLLEPSISKKALEGVEEASWFSDKYKNLKPITSFSKIEQKEIEKELNIKINQILNLSNELINSQNKDENRLGEFLKSTVEVPSFEYVYSNGKDVALAFWGFKSQNIKYRDFRLAKALQSLTNEDEKSSENQKIEYQLESNKKREINYKKIALISLIAILLATLLFLLKNFYDFKAPSKDKQENRVEKRVKEIDIDKIKIDETSPLKEKIITNRVMVLLKKGQNVDNFIEKIKTTYPNIEVIYSYRQLGLIEYEIKDNDRVKWIEIFKNLQEVEDAFSEKVLSSKYVPNDSGFNEEQKKWFFKEIQAYSGWEITKGKKEVVIAVLDNFFDINHPEIKDNIISPWNASNATNSVSTNPTSPHGTHVASLIAGKIDNNLGVSGVCPNCSIMPIQLAQGSFEGFSTGSLLRGFIYAVENRVDVINLSLGMHINLDFSKMSLEQKEKILKSFENSYKVKELLWNRMYQYAILNNIVVVTAAGNNDMFSEIDPMKRDDSIINVSAIDNSLNKANFSNFGGKVSVSAPGVDIYGAVLNKKFDFLAGTSMASPIVAGLAGLIKSKNRAYSPKLIKDVIIKTGKKLSYSKHHIGPLIQIEDALKEIDKYNIEDELEKLKKELQKCREKMQSEKLIIPKTTPKTFEFAEGLWKSTTDIFEYDTINKEIKKDRPIEIFFKIDKSGKGEIRLKKLNSIHCKGDIVLSFNKEKLHIKQTTLAICDDNQKFIKYNFYCEANSNRVAVCKADSDNSFEFELEKIED